MRKVESEPKLSCEPSFSVTCARPVGPLRKPSFQKTRSDTAATRCSEPRSICTCGKRRVSWPAAGFAALCGDAASAPASSIAVSPACKVNGEALPAAVKSAAPDTEVTCARVPPRRISGGTWCATCCGDIHAEEWRGNRQGRVAIGAYLNAAGSQTHPARFDYQFGLRRGQHCAISESQSRRGSFAQTNYVARKKRGAGRHRSAIQIHIMADAAGGGCRGNAGRRSCENRIRTLHHTNEGSGAGTARTSKWRGGAACRRGIRKPVDSLSGASDLSSQSVHPTSAQKFTR